MISLSRLKNHTHVDFHQEMLSYFKKMYKKAKLSQIVLAAYEAALKQETELLDRNFSSKIVADRRAIDAERCKRYIHLRALLKSLKYSDKDTDQAVYAQLADELKTLYNSRVTKASKEHKDATYATFVRKLREHASVLCTNSDFARSLSQLEVLNQQCIALEADRTNELAAFEAGAMLKARAKTDAIYRTINKMLEAMQESNAIEGKTDEGVDQSLKLIRAREASERKSLRIRVSMRMNRKKKDLQDAIQCNELIKNTNVKEENADFAFEGAERAIEGI